MFERVQYLVVLALIAAMLGSCRKEGEAQHSQPVVEHMSEMKVSTDFHWSASQKGFIAVQFDNPSNMSLAGELFLLKNASGETIAKQRAQGKSLVFKVELPANGRHFLNYPYSGQEWEIQGPGTYTFTIAEQGSNKRGKALSGGSCTVCNSPIVNNLAEQPVIRAGSYTITSENNVPGWETTAPDGKIEIWSSGFNGVPAQEGNQFFEINANNYPNAALFQTLCLEPGSTIRWSVYHRARQGTDVARVSIGATVSSAVEQAIMADGTNAWGYYSGTYQVPANQTTTVFVFESISTGSGNGSIGNFLDNFRIECDFDGDGVADYEDDFPEDPGKAYREFFPSSGKQVLAFEDLWPAKGDYDFNDLVISQQVELERNADQELIAAHFTLSIDAIGAGHDNGIALMLRKLNGTLLNGEKVSSFSGDIMNDPLNPNGFIVSANIYDELSEFYQNNGVGPSKNPDTLRFSLNFIAGEAIDFYPELYLFRTNNRGLEVHQAGFSPSAAFNSSLLNTLDDAGDFRTAEGLPWALEIITAGDYKHPQERIDMVEAFPQFQTWANSGGSQNQQWYDFPAQEKIFDSSF